MLTRTVTLGTVAVLALSLVGCTKSGSAPQAPTDPSIDTTARAQVAAQAMALLQAETQALAALNAAPAMPAKPAKPGKPAKPPKVNPLTGLLEHSITDHRDHLAALGSPVPTFTATTPAAKVDAQALVAAEWKGAIDGLAAAYPTGPAVAELLTKIAASRAVHADQMAKAAGLRRIGPLVLIDTAPGSGATPGASAAPAPTGTAATAAGTGMGTGTQNGPGPLATRPVSAITPNSSGSRAALKSLLAGEHAAIFAYSLIVARATGPQRDLAAQAWAEHETARAQISTVLASVGETPPPPEAAYQAGPVNTAAERSRLAATIERSLAAVAVKSVADSQAQVRMLSAQEFVAAVRRQAAWGEPVGALPGSASVQPTAEATLNQ